LAVAESLKALDPVAEILYIGQANSMEARVSAAAGLDFAAIKAGKFRRLHGANVFSKLLNPATLHLNARDLGRLVSGVGGSLQILRTWKPDVVFVKGGFVGLPVGLAAKLLGIPYIIHESDVSPGLTNRILGKWALKVATGFPVKSYHDFPPAKMVYVGNPVREELLRAHRLDGLVKFKLEQKLPVVLVTGGSLGAVTVNDVMLDSAHLLLDHCQIIHLTGEADFERVKFELGRMKLEHADRYHIYSFLMGDMAKALAVADVVVARAGANTIAELAALGKPTVLIPNYLMAGHQTENAKQLARVGAARVIDEPSLTPELLAGEVDRILESEEEQRALSTAIRTFAKADANEELARLILEVGASRRHKAGGKDKPDSGRDE